MILFLKCLPRMFKQANRDLRRHFSMVFSSVLSIGVALLMAMIMVVGAVNIGNFTTHIQSEFIIQVSIAPQSSEENIQELEKEIQDMEEVESVTYSSKDEELDELIAENGEVFSAYKDNNPLYDVLTVKCKDTSTIDEVNTKISKMNYVLKSTYGGSIVSKMIDLMGVVRKWGYIFVGILSLFAVFLIRNTVKMTIFVRRDEIAIMRTVGAMNWYITFPFMLEGIISGFFGALVPDIVCIVGYYTLYQRLNGVFMSDLFTLVKPFPFTIELSLVLLGIGVIVGMFGSVLATGKYLRWNR